MASRRTAVTSAAWQQSFDEELDLNELVPDIPMPSPKLPSLLSLAGRSASPSPAPSTMGPLSLYLGTHATQSQPAVQTKAETTELLSDSLRGRVYIRHRRALLTYGYRPAATLWNRERSKRCVAGV